MKAKKYKHLSFEDRCVIEEFLNNNYNFTKIGNRIGKDRTTISHEIKNIDFLEQLIIVIICHVVLKINLLMFAMGVLNLIIAKKYVILILMMLLIMNIKNL